MKTLYYVADPMCSWCWGFQPVLEKVKEALPEELSPVYIMGGLARDTDDPMPDAMQAHIQHAWRDVAAITGASLTGTFGKNANRDDAHIHLAGHFMRLKIKGLE